VSILLIQQEPSRRAVPKGLHTQHLTLSLFWMEFMDRSKFHRAVINTLSLLWNPFFATGWRLYALQYAIVHKKQPTDQDPNDA